MRCRIRDEGGPLEAGLQGQASSHPKLPGLRVLVVSVGGKGAARPRQARIKKTNEIEPLMTCRKVKNDVKTRRGNEPGISPRETCLRLGRRPA